jgi:hypothetical protein
MDNSKFRFGRSSGNAEHLSSAVDTRVLIVQATISAIAFFIKVMTKSQSVIRSNRNID